jgi:DNA modification methylase
VQALAQATMMKTIKTTIGEVRFCDCIEGMKGLADKTFDLCLTDPPYNEPLKDHSSPYSNFMVDHAWFDEASRIAKTTVFTPGISNIYSYPPPKWMIIWYKPGCGTRNKTGGFNTWEPFLWYGEGTIYNDFFKNIGVPFPCNHPCARPVSVMRKLLKQFKHKPTSCVDPFMGSGTTAQVCEELSIKYLGFEIEEKYAPDIEKRIALGQKARSQGRLF